MNAEVSANEPSRWGAFERFGTGGFFFYLFTAVGLFVWGAIGFPDLGSPWWQRALTVGIQEWLLPGEGSLSAAADWAARLPLTLVPALICAWPAHWTAGQRIVRGIGMHYLLSFGYALALHAFGVTIGIFWY